MSKAEHLADTLDAEFVTGRISNHTGREAAAELRRLSAQVAKYHWLLQYAHAIYPVIFNDDDTLFASVDEWAAFLDAKIEAALAARPGEKK